MLRTTGRVLLRTANARVSTRVMSSINSDGAGKAESVIDDDVIDAEVMGSSSTASAAASATTDATPEVKSESIKGAAETVSFRAETKRLLDIVTHSLYTDKEIFLRELISNASDACEKARYLATADIVTLDNSIPLGIQISTDPERNILTITDSGVGMTRDELMENLGVIAKSGSREFISKLDQAKSIESMDNIIGQFGVGFYSVFMVADKVEVYSKSATDDESAPGHYWTSDGSGEYTIAEASNVSRGTKLIIHLKDKQYSKPSTIKRIVKKHSNFVGFPLNVNGESIESLGAIWLKGKSEVTPEEHESFYKSIANAYDAPAHVFHFHTDAPLDLHALFYLPSRHLEKYGMGRLDPGVSLYSRKVLIQPNSKHILPDWLRFVKGVVDSEDIPLNISRESMQDTQLISRIRNALTRRMISFLQEFADDRPEEYAEWYEEFGNFIREGVATDVTHRDKAARLLRYDSYGLSSSVTDGKTPKPTVSLDSYVAGMPPTQKNIYYLYAPKREMAMDSPYLEAFKEKGIEVLFIYNQVDEMVMQSLKDFEKRPIMSVESNSAEVSTKEHSEIEKKSIELAKGTADWMKEALGPAVTSVDVSSRTLSAPAIIVDQDASSTRRMMLFMENAGGEQSSLPAQKLEINPNHPIIIGLGGLRESNAVLAETIAQTLLDNALITSGLLADPRTMVNRINSLMSNAVSGFSSLDTATEPVVEAEPELVEAEAMDAVADDSKTKTSKSKTL